MMQLYTWRTPNGRKPPILLAELGWKSEIHLVDLGKGEQNSPEFVARSPNGKIPARVDADGDVVVFESGAILQYLAEKAGRFLSAEPQSFSRQARDARKSTFSVRRRPSTVTFG